MVTTKKTAAKAETKKGSVKVVGKAISMNPGPSAACCMGGNPRIVK